MTGPQEKGVRVLVEAVPMGQIAGVTPKQFARLMWPDSPAWNRYTRNNAKGGTMPMLAGKMLRTLVTLGMATERSYGFHGHTVDYRPTPKARKWVADQGELL